MRIETIGINGSFVSPRDYIEQQSTHVIHDFVESEMGYEDSKLTTLAEALWEEKNRDESLPNQLNDPIRRGQIGINFLTLEQDPNASRDLDLLLQLQSTILILTNPDESEKFISWFSTKVKSEQTDECLYLLQCMMQYTTFLDRASYVQLFNGETDQIPVLPLHTLATCGQLARQSTDVTNRIDFTLTHDLFAAQYHFIYDTVNLMVDNDESNSTQPNAQLLGKALLPWVDTQVRTEQRSFEDALLGALKYLHIYEAQHIENFIEELESRYGADNPAVQTVRNRAIEYHLVNVTLAEYEAVQHQGVRTIVSKTTKDANDIDFSQEFEPVPRFLRWYLLTGSEAPIHVGHLHTHEVILALMQERGELEEDSDIRGVFLNAPIVSPHILEQAGASKKSAAQLGRTATRIEAIIAVTRNLKHVLLTTQLQPQFTENPEGRIKVIENRIRDKISDELPGCQVGITRIFGADKIIADSDQDGSHVKEPEIQYAGNATMVGRRGYLHKILENLGEIRRKYPKLELVLTPGMPKSSSTQAIKEGSYDIMSSVELLVVNGYWTYQHIEKRALNPNQESVIPSVTDIDQELRDRLLTYYSAD